MSYQVVVPLVLAQTQDGQTHHVYQGGVIQWLSDEQAEHFLAEGLVVKVDDAPADDDDGRPAKSAKNADLVEWLVANVSKDDGSDYTAEELGTLTKAELWAIIDSVE